MPKVSTLLFDCDNTLVLSETLAFEACAELANEILASQGISDRYTGPALFNEFVGQNFRGMMSSLAKKYSLSLPPDAFDDYVSREEDAVIGKIRAALEPCMGVDAVLASLADTNAYEMAVVSSSAGRRVQASVDKVGMDRYFPSNRIFSAATSLAKPTSKPDPAIYLHACEVLGKQPGECVAVEDSKNGTLSAVRAGIKTVGYIGSYESEEQDKMRGVLEQAGANPIMKHWNEFESLLKQLESPY
ncbi:Haloacid dehalogenase-like hydrolase [Mycena indigotica]|uniref:Haloacid dehalogenase-like hydrolase n=1 Tax=Mycena indigotica TaxID=2126181 RepID=A0A8H6WER0_9AGAR|nr:Haloacid dehalogenase-like hydrolase [Mycena indigotica]KAF7315959.1 Haloacid dehalogenase-like hydrolase [Mycena indigotica]